LNDFNYQREDAQLRNQDMWRNKEYGDSRDDLAYNREVAKKQFDYEKFLNEQNRGDRLSQLDIDNKYRQSRFDWDINTDARDYDRNVFTQDRAYNYNEEQDRLSREDRERQFKYERYQKDLEANYPNTVMGQLEERKRQELEERTKNEETQKMYDIQSWISSALTVKSKDLGVWLSENAMKMTNEEYQAVIKALKDYGDLDR
jgi:hypothetical protein